MCMIFYCEYHRQINQHAHQYLWVLCVFTYTRSRRFKTIKISSFIKSQEGSTVLSSHHAPILCTGSPVSASREQVDAATIQSTANAQSSSAVSETHINGTHFQPHIPLSLAHCSQNMANNR